MQSRNSRTQNDSARALNFGEFVNGKAQQTVPSSLARNEPELSDFANRCKTTCLKLLELFAIGLQVRGAGLPVIAPIHCNTDTHQ